MNNETVEVKKSYLRGLEEDSAHLEELEALGVDNWQGYIGRERGCNECDESVSWLYDKCTNCGAGLPDGIDLI